MAGHKGHPEAVKNQGRKGREGRNHSTNHCKIIQSRLLLGHAKCTYFSIRQSFCINDSDWGHDFRPDYKRIKQILPYMPPNLPVLATTATASQRVMGDIAEQLGDNIRVYRGQLVRESLHLQCLHFPKRSHRLAWLADTIPQIPGTGIVYTATVRDAEQVAEWLRQQGFLQLTKTYL